MPAEGRTLRSSDLEKGNNAALEAEKPLETKLTRIAELAKQRPKVKLQTLIHAIDEASLIAAHHALDADKALGVDGMSKEEYGKQLQENVSDLLGRMKRQAYKPQPVKRGYIPKGDDKKRPIGILAYEDKVVQKALNEILTVIYETEFLDCSYGFRPGRSCHDALKEVGRILEKTKVNYVVDADIRGFFDNVDHQWMMKFLQERIQDPNLLRLINRILKARVMEEGVEYDTETGTQQGGVISPTLANVYLHYVLDLWFEVIIKRQCRGEAYLIRYADDFVCFFQYKDDAEAFYGKLIDRLGKFNLEIAQEKTKILEFGRYAEERRGKRGEGKPDTFDFLGFTHYCSNGKLGRYRVKRRTSKKKFSAKLKIFAEWLHKNMHGDVRDLIKQINVKLVGHFRYYGVTDNYRRIKAFRYFVTRELFRVLNRRNQKGSFNWDSFATFQERYPLVRARIYAKMVG